MLLRLGNQDPACCGPGQKNKQKKNKKRHDTIKLLEENVSKTFSDTNHTNVFSGQSPKAIEIKAKINKWDLIKLTSFCTTKETINKTKRQLRGWKKIFANDVTGKGFILKIYKQLIQLNNKKQTAQ